METITARFLDLVRDSMVEVERLILSDMDDHHPHLRTAIDQIVSSGGKRIRPTIVLLASRMLEADPKRSVAWAAAIEMLHTATLVHDDLIDGATLRRGLATMNSRWSSGAAVLIGDYIFAKAADLAAQTDSTLLMKRTSETLMTIVNGEINQLFRFTSGNMRRDYFDRIYAKTASLFEVAAEGSAILGGASPEVIEALKDFGNHIGLAFQILDDILDFTGDPDQVGKPVAHDLKQGLITLPTLIYLENHPEESDLKHHIIDRPLDDTDLEQFVATIRASGAIDQAFQEARQFIDTGVERLMEFPLSPERDAFIELSHYVIHRSL